MAGLERSQHGRAVKDASTRLHLEERKLLLCKHANGGRGFNQLGPVHTLPGPESTPNHALQLEGR